MIRLNVVQTSFAKDELNLSLMSSCFEKRHLRINEIYHVDQISILYSSDLCCLSFFSTIFLFIPVYKRNETLSVC